VRERDRFLAVEAAIRHELARDLHDGPAQLLSAILMSVNFLRDAFERAPQEAPNELLQLEAVAQKALYQVRNLLFDLRPVILETQGLGPAIEAYVERLRMVEPFNIMLDVDSLTTRFPAKTESAIFGIVQEAVNNAKRHASPRNIWIEATQSERLLTLKVRDDGRGFDPSRVQSAYDQRGSFGLLNMRERAEIARGQIQIDSRPLRGTTVILTVPL
jgi:signal transduction histidine kinase